MLRPRTLGDFVRRTKDEILARWSEQAVAALSLSAADRLQLVDDLPAFLEDLAVSLSEGPENGHHRSSARAHGRQRKQIGLDIGALAIEFSLVGETVLELAHRHGISPTLAELRGLFRVIAQATEQSVTEYAALRDSEVEDQAARHYSFVAHELRLPLQNASLATELLSEHCGDAARHIDTLARAIGDLTSVVDSSLLLTRLRGHPTPRYERFDARAPLDEAVEVCRLLAARRSVDVEIECEDFALEADRKLTGCLLTNLVSNAIKFTAREHVVTLRGSQVDGRARFEVADHCGGMPDDVPGRLFQPHVQEGDDRSGFGLGLAIVKQAVDAQSGTIRVNNEPGVGCCFVVDLPLTKLDDL